MNAIDESLPLANWKQSAGEEVANGISHGIGLVAAIIGTPILLLAAFHHGDIHFLIGTIIFTTTMLLVYLASTVYHAWPQTNTKSVSYTHLRAHETPEHLVCRLLLEK